MMADTAYLSNKGRYIIFSWQDRTIRFMGPYNLQKFQKIKEWDNGYLVVEVKYADSNEGIEDYIDLIPVLERLYIDPVKFLQPIKNVEVQYA